ncbi:MAG: peptidylprolyl isomerase [Pirellulales bacterium]
MTPSRGGCGRLLAFLGLVLLGSFPAAAGTIVRFDTVLGNIDVELKDKAAPKTVANFLKYVTDGDYTNTFFHRSVKDFVIQGGGFQTTNYTPVATDPPVVNEYNESNQRGTIAMARVGKQVDSATSQWFFNLGDNSDLDTVDQGFTVFGHVIGDGMQVVDAIAALPIYKFGSPFGEIPLRDYTTFPNPKPTLDNLVVLNAVSVIGTISDETPWRNATMPADVDNDGGVFPVDALTIINELNGAGPRALARPAPPGLPPPFLDPSGDDMLAPNDALWVINELNAQQAVPEPSGFWLALLAAGGGFFAVRRRPSGSAKPSPRES